MTLVGLQLAVCDGSEGNAETNLRAWLNGLVKAGVLTRLLVDDGKLTSNGSYQYHLVNDIGPRAPVVRAKYGVVYDPNSNTALPIVKRGKHRRLGGVNG